MSGAITAMLTPSATPGRYRIDVGSVSIESRYPENRMAKALALAGVTGEMQVYGPSLDGKRAILRNSVRIGAYSRGRLSENDKGFRWEAWSEPAPASLADAAATLRITLKEAQAAPAPASVPGAATCPSVSIPAGGGR